MRVIDSGREYEESAMSHVIPGIDLPADPNARVWRYMSISKLDNLFSTASLWFARADQFDDKTEGIVPLQTATDHPHVAAWINRRRTLTFVNCWHANEYESAAMWEAYTGGDFGVAIESSVERLAGVLEQHRPIVYLGLVRYIDLTVDRLDGWRRATNNYHPIMHKRRLFEGERELRAIINPMSKESLAASRRGDLGMVVPVDLKRLILGIRVTSRSPREFIDHVVNTAHGYGITVPVITSTVGAASP